MARIILVALFVLAVSAQRAPLPSCEPQNPFLKHLVQLGMPTYETPKFGVHMCGTEFEMHGTCCDATKIKEHVVKDRKRIVRATDIIIGEFERFMRTTPHIMNMARLVLTLRNKVQRKYIKQIKQGIGRKLQALQALSKRGAPVSSRPQYRPRIIGVKPAGSPHQRLAFKISRPRTPSPKLGGRRRPARRGGRKGCKDQRNKGKKNLKTCVKKPVDPFQIVKPLQDQIEKLRQMNINKAFGKDTRDCWTHIANLRASSVCSTCSGRSHEFFWKNKALMSQEVCVGVLDKCYKPLRQLTYFVSVLNLIPNFLGLGSKISKPSEKEKQDKVSTQKLNSHLKEGEIKTTANLFQKADFVRLTAKIARQTALKGTELFKPEVLLKAERALCSRFIVLNHKPIIVRLTRLFGHKKQENTQTRDLLHQMHKSIKNSMHMLRAPVIQPHWRVLRMLGKSLGADVAVLTANSDSAYSGVGVSGNHAMDFSNQP